MKDYNKAEALYSVIVQELVYDCAQDIKCDGGRHL